nr:MAG TPA: hypothetical protein [Caudoviricetes sp.]
MKFKIFDYAGREVIVDAGDKEIRQIRVEEVTGDEVIEIEYVDGSIEEFDSGICRLTDFRDGAYRISGDDLKEWLADRAVIDIETRIINLTPHAINIVDKDGNKIVDLPSEGEARAVQTNISIGSLGDIPLVKTEFGEPIGLPEPAENTFYVVSAITANAAKIAGRTTDDLLLTAETVRNEKNQIIGCRALAKI